MKNRQNMKHLKSWAQPTWLRANKLVCHSASHSDCIVIHGKLNGKKAVMLLDSGASGNFLRSSFVDGARESLQINSVSPKKINLANGSSLTTNQVIPNVSTEVQGKLVQSTFIILPELSNSYDAILGMPYLESADPLISFKSKTIRWQTTQNLH